MSDPEFIDPGELQPGPIHHESLPEELRQQIQAVYDVLGRYFNMTAEDFEAGFQRDAEPEAEVHLWMDITAAWIAYHEDYLDDKLLPDAEEKKLLSALIAISTGIDDPSKLGVPVEVGDRLLECFGELEDEDAAEEDE